MNSNEKKVFESIQAMENLHLIGQLEGMQDNQDLFQAIKEHYLCSGSGEFEFEWTNNTFEKSEVNTMLSESDYNCYIKNIVGNIDGTFLIVCDCIEED